MAILGAVNPIFSNRVEALFEILAHRLKNKPDSPFSGRLIIVPGLKIKSWLEQKIADDPKLGTTLGIKILPLEEALYFLKNKFIGHGKKCLSLSDLSCLIEPELDQLIDIDPLIKDWIEGKGKKKLYLTQTIAHLFQKYGRFSPDSLAGWQKSLWDRLYSNTSPWTYPYDAFTASLSEESTPMEVDLFGFSFLSNLEYTFFKTLSLKIPLYLYLFSPCLHFWSDVATEKEKRLFLKSVPDKSLESLDALLTDTNPLLANFGKMGREMAKQLETAGEESLSAYVSSKEALAKGDYELFEEATFLTDEEPSVLRQIQADILFLRNPKITPRISIPSDDRSLEFHRLSNKPRELECLKDLILRLNQEGVDDILVMAPDISLYEPYIDSEFHGFPYTLSDRTKPEETPFLNLLNFYEDPLNSDFLSFIEGGPFDPEEIEWIKEEGQLVNFYQEGIQTVLEALMSEKCEITKLQTWDNVILFVKEVKASAPQETETLANWALWIENLPLKAPEGLLQKLKQKGERLHKPISYTLFKDLITKEILSEREKKGDKQLGQIRFSSLAPMRIVPAKAIILIGMKEGTLPRTEVKHPLDQSDGDFAPTQGDFDRTLFLETLLSAREHLFVLWSESESPSRLIEELLSYLKIAFDGDFEPIIHPARNFDPWYFLPSCPFKTFNLEAYHAHIAVNTPSCEDQIMISFKEKKEVPLLKITDLKRLLKNPIKYYEEENGIKKPFRDDIKDSLPFQLNALENWKAKNLVLQGKSLDLKGKDFFSKIKIDLKETIEQEISAFLEEVDLHNLQKKFIPPTKELPIYGEIKGIAKEGLVLSSDKNPEKILEALPELLLLQKDDPKKTTLYFIKNQKLKTLKLESLPELKNLLAYAKKARNSPYPFVPKAIKPLLKQDLIGLKKALEPYNLDDQAEMILNQHYDEVKTLFGSLEKVL